MYVDRDTLKDYFLTLPQLTLKFYLNLPSRSTSFNLPSRSTSFFIGP